MKSRTKAPFRAYSKCGTLNRRNLRAQKRAEHVDQLFLKAGVR